MSGGVDSSVALILLKKQGFEPIGVTLKLPIWENKNLPPVGRQNLVSRFARNKLNACRDNVCCTPVSIKIAQKICQKLQVPYFVIEAQKEFRKEVIAYFVQELKKYHTPNPCLICNRNLKFQLLIELAEKMKIPYVATGHYAKVEFNKKTGLYEFSKGKDKNKDQSYSLSFLTQKQLKYLIFPLGNYFKAEVYKIAKKEGFPYFEKIKQSQNFCFVSNKALPLFIQKEIGKNPGPIMDLKGNMLGTHQGLYFYTLGQRKGLNLANGPFYVIDFNIKKNTLIVSKNKKDLYKKEAMLSPLNLISGKITQKKLKVSAKIRSRSKSASANLYLLNKNKAKIVFNKPQKAITPGQFCVFYQGQKCLGGGIIS